MESIVEKEKGLERAAGIRLMTIKIAAIDIPNSQRYTFSREFSW